MVQSVLRWDPATIQPTIAAFIVTCFRDSEPLEPCVKVLSVGVGTRCVATGVKLSHAKCRVLDGHAEIMARRGLVRHIAEAVIAINNGGEAPAYLCADGTSPAVSLSSASQLYLVVNRTPCGDCAVVTVGDASGAHPLLQTPSGRAALTWIPRRCVVTPCSHVLGAHRDPLTHAITGLARTKPGKGWPSMTMSCSDKILKWVCCGLEGSRCSEVVRGPLRLAGLIIRCQEPVDCAVKAKCEASLNGRCPELCRENISVEFVIAPSLRPSASPSSVSIDAALSASLWIREPRFPLPRKRTRDGEPKRGNDSGYSVCLINSKDGIPLGVTAKTFDSDPGGCAAAVSSFRLAELIDLVYPDAPVGDRSASAGYDARKSLFLSRNLWVEK